MGVDAEVGLRLQAAQVAGIVFERQEAFHEVQNSAYGLSHGQRVQIVVCQVTATVTNVPRLVQVEIDRLPVG